jgi:hypothetical protein
VDLEAGREEEIDWVEIVRVHDRFEADVTAGFLRDHGVPVQTAGGGSTALPTMGLTDMRILVPRAELERAGQVLEAMKRGAADTHPFRDAPPEPYEAPVAKRKAAFAVMLALLVPIGGGHFYARHGAAGTLLAAGIIGGVLGARFGIPALVYASALLVVIDAVTSPFAVRRTNAGAASSEGRQRLWAFAAVVAAYTLALNAIR